MARHERHGVRRGSERREVRSVGQVRETRELPCALAFVEHEAREAVEPHDRRVGHHVGDRGPLLECEPHVAVHRLGYRRVVGRAGVGDLGDARAGAGAGAAVLPRAGAARRDMEAEAAPYAPRERKRAVVEGEGTHDVLVEARLRAGGVHEPHVLLVHMGEVGDANGGEHPLERGGAGEQGAAAVHACAAQGGDGGVDRVGAVGEDGGRERGVRRGGAVPPRCASACCCRRWPGHPPPPSA